MINEKLRKLFLDSLIMSYKNPFDENLEKITNAIMDIMHDCDMYDEVSETLDEAKQFIQK